MDGQAQLAEVVGADGLLGQLHGREYRREKQRYERAYDGDDDK
jgi:hypothetical protein